MPFHHRIPALWTAALATLALAFCALAGKTCSFLELDAKPGFLLLTANDVELIAVRAYVGVLCKNEFYDENDQMWKLSRIFLCVSLAMGGASVILTWAISSILPPTDFNWRLLSFGSALTAVLQVPIFLIFEVEACAGHRDSQTCSLSMGSYYLMASTVLWISVVICTQCLDPPLWGAELSAWRARKDMERVRQTHGDNYDEEYADFRITGLDETEPDLMIESKSSRQNRSSRFFGRSKQSDMSLPAVSTESMNEEDFDLYSPRGVDGSFDERVVLRVQPDGRRPGDNSASLASHEDLESVAQMTEQGWLYNSAIKELKKDGNVSYFHSSSPSKATERINIVSSSQSKPKKRSQKDTNQNAAESAQIGSFSIQNTTNTFDETHIGSADILADLVTEGTRTIPSNSFYVDDPQIGPLNGTYAKAPMDKYTSGIRAITKKLKKDSSRRRSRRQSRRGGYEVMLEDEDSEDEPFMSPPIEVKIQPFANFDDENFNTLEFTDDEKDVLMDDWNALHKATTAGVRLGLQEGYSDDEVKNIFDPFGTSETPEGYHSDPEPTYYASDESKSHMSVSEINRAHPQSTMREEDSSTISSGSHSQDSGSENVKPRKSRRRIPSSPNISIRSSGSLIALTINEETDQDILEENSGGEDELEAGYSMKRTMSAPEVRKYGNSRRLRTRFRRDHEASSLVQLPRRHNGEEKKDDDTPFNSPLISKPIVVDTQEPVAHVPIQDLLSLPRFHSPKTDQILPDPPTMQSTAVSRTRPRSLSAVRRIKREFHTQSLSPTRGRRPKSETWRNDTVSLGGMNSRIRVNDDDSTNQPSHTSCSNLSKRAREFRIKRMQSMKETPTRSNDSNLYLQDRQQASSHSRLHVSGQDSDDQSQGASSYFEDRENAHSDALVDSRREQISPIDRNVIATADEISRFSPTTLMSTDDMLSKFSGVGTERSDDLPLDTDAIMNSFTEEKTPDRDSSAVLWDEDVDSKYGNSVMDELDLQLIEVRRPIGKEYGDDEVSL